MRPATEPVWIVDDDDDSRLRAVFYLDIPDGSERGDALDASTMMDGVLLGPGGESGDTAVQSVSWGRIKASLGVDFRSDSYSGKD